MAVGRAKENLNTFVNSEIDAKADGAKVSFEKALADAKEGKADAQFILAKMYQGGVGVTKNSEEAFKWITEAAKQNYIDAQYVLGDMYLHGEGVKKDENEASKWFLLAATKNHALAQYTLGWMHLHCSGVKKNEKEANKWFLLAATQNCALACFALAQSYFAGRGVEKNIALAVQWFYQAKQLDYPSRSQLTINAALTQFCNDPRYNPGKKRFNEKAINKLLVGTCVGSTIRFLTGAYLEKNPPVRKNENNEQKQEKIIRDDLTQFHLERNTILNWDGKRDLTSEEQIHFFSYLYTTYIFQVTTVTHTQGELHNLIFMDNEERSFKVDFSCTLCVTQDQLAKKLELLRKTNRLMYISTITHSMGLFERRFFGPNNTEGDKEYKSSAEIAAAIFTDGGLNPLKPFPISITIFARIHEPIAVTYPSYEELLADCAPGSEPSTKHKRNALHESVANSKSLECVAHYLKTCDVNAEDWLTHTAFHYAGDIDRKDIARLLLAHGAKLSLPSLALAASDLCKKMVEELTNERNQNKASESVQEWRRRGILSEVNTQILSPEQRSVLETANDIAKELKLTIRRESKKEERAYFSIDATICQVLRKIQQYILTIDLRTAAPQAREFHKALSGLDIAATEMSMIQERLRNALCAMESNRIKSADLDKILRAYSAYKSKLFTSKPSKESLEAAKEMREAKTEAECSQIAVRFIKANPKRALTDKIIEAMPRLRKIC